MTAKIQNVQNQRTPYLIAVALTMLLGLASRKFSDELPSFVAENSGDAMWAMMVYFGFRFLLYGKKLVLSLWLSLLFSFGIEFSQLYQDVWINELRETTLGALILGKGFLVIDLVRYAAGIVLAAFLDRFLLKMTKSSILKH